MQIYQESRGELLRFLTARVGDRAEAEDLLHDLWLRIQSSDAGPIANGRSYLYRAAQNLVLDRARARQRRLVRETAWSGYGDDGATSEPADPRADIEAEIAAREDAAALAAALAKLPEKAGMVFRLHKIDGLPHAEIAARLGISRSGVEKHIATAMTHLRRALDGGTA
ncbi:sigma-70 family RNA polymerase sigma factor [Sphingomonas populi]|uniref:Sigma-70 family RNA polymerase sigma factor n=1 Tax=Sphingomonas populi TaxID=2484750 RepID=A0A4Q6Y1X4_9SPHN|nr:sigma-70 family RNA polymerase sigma factor [Sphingomonas populi]RZF63036.1 sigma-70 family RNA polymerase sigma factor [Sphingomonas populi]